MNAVLRVLNGRGLFARAIRGVGWTVLAFGALQALRLASNLILARLLFPEAFGLMALISVLIVGLAMFSDVGLSSSVMQSRRGDDPEFLDTVWTIQVIRGVGLWLLACAIAWPAARFYGEPMLAQALPVAALALIASGFSPTRLLTAGRHLLLGRVSALDFAAQAIGVAVMIGLAWMTQSVWALVIGVVVAAVAKLVLAYVIMPGMTNSFLWDRTAAREIVSFGKWIVLSTALNFMTLQGDKAILGKYLSLDMFGVYNIGYFLASFPMLLGTAVVGQVFIPLYRETFHSKEAETARRLRLMRFALTGGVLALLLVMAFGGVFLVELLYDSRYQAAGAIVVLIACLQIVNVIGLTYDQAAIAAGDSRGYFVLFAARATLQIVLFLVGVEMGGLVGALAGQGLALIAVHPLIVILARRHRVWDPGHDAVYLAVGFSLGGLALWLHRDAIIQLIGLST